MPEPTDLTVPAPSLPAAPLPPALVEAADELRRRSRSDATWAVYKQRWRSFEGWCHALGYAPLDCQPAHVVVYLTKLQKEGRSKTWIMQSRAAISAAYETAGKVPPTWDPTVRTIAKAIRRADRHRPLKKQAITEDLLARIVATCDRTTVQGKRDAALLLVGQIGAFRRAALARMQAGDLARDERGYSVLVPWDKTDQEGRGRYKILPVRGGPLCPVAALDDWLATSKPTGSVFGITGQTVALVVKRAAEAAGLDPSLFSGHSLRSGFVTGAIRGGAGLPAVQAQTHHKSADVLLGYYQQVDPFTDNAATMLAKKT